MFCFISFDLNRQGDIMKVNVNCNTNVNVNVTVNGNIHMVNLLLNINYLFY